MSPKQFVIQSLILCVLACVLMGRMGCSRRDYRGYSVLRCAPQTANQVAKLRALSAESDWNHGIQFWTEPFDVNRTVDIMVEPEMSDELDRMLTRWRIPSEQIIGNVSELIEETSPPAPELSRQMLTNSSLRAQALAPEQYHKQYHSYAEIEAKLNELAEQDPRVTLETIGRSTEGRDIHLVKVSSDPEANKPVILIDAGHHAREWISHATAVYIIESLVNPKMPRMSASLCRTTKCRQVSMLGSSSTQLKLDEHDFWFIPVVNPDGYEHTHRYDRLWRKTRSPGLCRGYDGVDPNRNYPFHWMGPGASQNSCSDIYAGPKPASEPEVRAVISVMDAYKSKIVMYLTLHSYSQLIMSPYGYARIYPDNYENLKSVANAWIESTGSLRNTRYKFGTSAILLYPAAGGSDDYAHGVANIKFSYAIELPDEGQRGFILPQSEIIPVGQETVMGLKSMIKTMDQILKA